MIDGLLWSVPLAILVLGIRQPRWGLLAFFGALPLFGAPPGGPYLAQLDAAVLAALLTGWRAGPGRRSVLDGAVGVFALVGLLSLVPPPYRPPGLDPRHWLDLLAALPATQAWGLFFSWRMALDLIVGWALFTTVRRAFTGRSLRPLGLAMGAGLVFVLAIGFAELFGWIDLWAYRPIGGFLYDDRFHSLFFHSGWFAEYLVLATPLAVAAWATGERHWRSAAVALGAVALAALLLTQQRGGWITAGVQLLVLGAAFLSSRGRTGNPWRIARTLAAGAAVAAVVVVGVLVVRQDMRQGVEERIGVAVSDLSARTWVWQRSGELLRERPVLGWGLGTFSPVLDARFPSSLDPWGHRRGWLTAHSLFIHVLVETGLLGLIALLFVLGLAATVLYRSLRRTDPGGRQLTYGLLVSVVGFAVYGLVQYMLFIRAISWLFWGLIGALATLPGASAGGTEGASGRPFWWTAQRLRRAALLLAAAALVGAVVRPLWAPPPVERGNREYGLYAPEVTGEGEDFRWTDGHAAERVRWLGSVMVLRLANGHPSGGARPVDVEVRVDGRVVLEERLRSGWESFRIDVGAPSRESLLLEIEARPTFRPYRERPTGSERSRDIRRLGVAVAPVIWE